MPAEGRLTSVVVNTDVVRAVNLSNAERSDWDAALTLGASGRSGPSPSCGRRARPALDIEVQIAPARLAPASKTFERVIADAPVIRESSAWRET